MPHNTPKGTRKTGTTSAEKKGPRRHVDEYSEVMRQEISEARSVAAFVPKPKRLTIDIQAKDEQIVLLLRQHSITQVKWVVVAAIMFFAPIIFSSIQVFEFLPSTYRFASFLGWYLLTAGFSIESYLKWFYRVFIVTDERIIDVDFISMIYKDVSTTKIDKIEDITSLTSGFFSSIFDYGTVTIQTAATKQELNFENVPHPAKVTALLNEMILEEELEKFEGRVK
jgi:hypothetical protein